ncbi:cobalamin biosynthesis protein CobW [Kaustia mangrovi]|uniref:Cobalamin biosynthesis protein CobW n=1 Tax=Kaustia mangrovi TaxID=2593653 RepID=A0A7S8HD92_9HYPH|nr:cobalamin biosynthesis protein CobW [Kaustia mangrovi]QPC44385.1 cobalamin biosynthesis protein CobW [Kaustia mangrovi]
MAIGQAKIPATVVTGFLGAGKTTVIRNLLENAGGRRIALIVNEFGSVGVDGEVLKGCGDALCGEDDLIELANGCICCTVADDFVPTMTALLERETPPDHIVIETSGLALPQPLVHAFNWPEIRSRVTVDGIVAVVDGAALADGHLAFDEAAVEAQRAEDEALDHESPLEELFEDQLNCADIVLVNKADLVADAALESIEAGLKARVRDGVTLVRSRQGAVPASVLIGLGAAVEADMAARKSHHEMEGHEDHDHDDFATFVVEIDAETDREALLDRVARAVSDHPILRLKGFAAVAGADARLVVQAVGPRVNAYFDRPWKPGETRRSSLVVIGETGHLDADGIARTLQG